MLSTTPFMQCTPDSNPSCPLGPFQLPSARTALSPDPSVLTLSNPRLETEVCDPRGVNDVLVLGDGERDRDRDIVAGDDTVRVPALNNI